MEASTLHDSSNETCCNIDDFVLVLPSPPLTETRRGVLRFVGLTDFAEGVWAGVEVVGVFGRNDGSVRGRKYFSCVPGQGLFVRPSQVQPYTAQHVDASPSPAPPPTAAVVAAPTVKEEELIAAREAAAAEAEVARRLRAELAEVRQHASAAEASLTTLQKELNAKQASQGAEDASVKERMRLEAELANMRTNAAEMHTKHEAEQVQAAREKELLLAEVHVLKVKAAGTSEPTLPAEPLSSTEELARMTKERDDLHMMCGLLEEELSQQKKQADEFAQLLQAAAEERAKEHPGLAPNDAHEQQQHDVATTSNANELRSLKMELDTANLTIFQLTKEKEATSELRRSYEELSNAAERQKVVQREREEKIVLEYEEALQHLRRLKDAAQRECAMAREEAARKMEASNTATRRPDFVLSASEREMYEEKLLAQQRLLLRTIQPLQLMPCCCMPGAQDVGASPQPLEAVVRAKVADLRHALETTSIARVLDFSSPTACAASTRKLFGVEHTSTAA